MRGQNIITTIKNVPNKAFTLIRNIELNRRNIIIIAVVVFILFLIVGAHVRVGPDEVGVRTDNFGFSGRGIVQEDFGPGWHLNIPLIQTWNVFPARTRRVEMTKDPRYRSNLGTEALLVQSSDGDRVMLDINIFYRIKPGMAHRLLQDSGTGDSHVGVLLSLARDSLRAVFGTLKTEQFYDPVARYEKSREALEAVRKAMEPRFIEVVDILNTDVEFEPKYEQKIKDKKLADQTVELSKAQTRAAEEQAKVTAINIDTASQVKVIETKADSDAARIKAEAESYAAQTKGDADLYRDQLTAKGNLAIAKAEAKVKQAKTQALTGSGGANVAALQAVRNFKLDNVTFPTSGRDFFDVREMAARLGARP